MQLKHASHSSFTWPKSRWLSATVWKKTESHLMRQYCNTSFCPTLYNNWVISNSMSLACLCCHCVCTVLSRTLNHLRPPRLLCFFSLKQHVLGFCLALSASLIPLLTRVHAECTAHSGRHWPGCFCVRLQLMSHTLLINVTRVCAVSSAFLLVKTCASPAEDWVTPDWHMNSTPTFYSVSTPKKVPYSVL